MTVLDALFVHSDKDAAAAPASFKREVEALPWRDAPRGSPLRRTERG